MSTADWPQVYESEIRYPSDLIRDGHQYRFGYSRPAPLLAKVIERIRREAHQMEPREIIRMHQMRGRVIRVHRVSACG